jgi:hypothetical protein
MLVFVHNGTAGGVNFKLNFPDFFEAHFYFPNQGSVIAI